MFACDMNSRMVAAYAVAGVVGVGAAAAAWCFGSAEVLKLAGYPGVADGSLHPLAWFAYADYYGFHYSRWLTCWLDISAVAGAIPGGLMALGAVRLLRQKKRPLYGEARFAQEAEIIEAGFRAKDHEAALWLGRFRGKLLRLRGQEHVAIIASTRAGKGVGYVIPNALMWRGSLVVLDMKKEVWGKTAGARREAGQRVYMFDPLAEAGATHRWNPFSYVRRGTTHAFSDLLRIFEMLFPDEGADDFFTPSARKAAAGLALYVAETPELPFTMGQVARIISMVDPSGYLTDAIRKRQSAGGNYSEQVVQAPSALIRDPTGRSTQDIVKTIDTRLQLWLDPHIDAATAVSDFDLRDLRQKIFAIHVGVTREGLSLLKPLLSLFFQQVVEVNSRTAFEDDPEARHRVLMLLDEFAQIDRMKVLAQSFALVAGYGFRIMMILQSRAQLSALYGEAEARAILENCACKVQFRTTDVGELRNLSESLGYNTVQAVSYQRPRFWLAGHGGSRRGETVSDQRRALRLPQEIARMGEKQVLILHSLMPPLIAERIEYFREKLFTSLIKDPPFVQPIPVEVRPAPPLEKAAPKGRGKTEAPPPSDEPAQPPTQMFLSDMLGRDFDLAKFQTDPEKAREIVGEVVAKAGQTARRRSRAKKAEVA